MTITTELRTEAAQTHTKLIAATTTAYNAIMQIGLIPLNIQESMLLLTINSKEELNLTERSQKEVRHDAVLNAYSSIHGHMHYFPRAVATNIAKGDAEAIQNLIKGAEEAIDHANDTIKALTNN
jgi:hypothetical protein